MDLGEERNPRGRRQLVLPKKQVEVKQTDMFDGDTIMEVNATGASEKADKEFESDFISETRVSTSENDWSVPDSFESERPRERVVLDAVALLNESEQRLEKAKTPKDFFDVGNDKGRVEGMIEGYIMAMFNQGVDLDSVSKKLVLTFNITSQKAENYLQQFYEKRNIEFESI